MASVYAERIRWLMSELQNAFTNQIQRQGEYRSDDILPGDRYAILKLESYDRNPDRADVSMNVGTSSARSFRFLVLLAVGVDCSDMGEQEAQLAADVEAAIECLNLEDAIAGIKTEMSQAFGMIEDLILKLPVDQGLSQRLHDPNTWILNLTAEVELRFWIGRDLDGRHKDLVEAAT